MNTTAVLERSYAEANRELIHSFDRYMESHGNSLQTRRSYARAIAALVEELGSASVVNVERTTLRILFAQWQSKGLNPNSIRLYTCAFRSFFRFLILGGLTRHDPTFLLAQRKIPTRVPIVLTIEQVEKLIEAAQNPFEAVVVELLYGTGCRVGELVNLRLEDILWGDPSSIRIHGGKGNKDRVALFGKHTEVAIRAYQAWRPSQRGYLFEVPPPIGVIYQWAGTMPWKKGYWHAKFYLGGRHRHISIGSVEKLPTKEHARQQFLRLIRKFPGYHPIPARPYSDRAIRKILNRLARRAGIEHIHPHALRRAMASHMLQRGANLRVVQDLLGHERLTTTMRYTHLDAEHIRAAYEKHPHAKGESDDDGKE